MTAFTIGGAIASQVFWNEVNRPVVKFSRLFTWFTAAAILLFALGFITRPEWGISKIRATPSWVLICSAIMLLFFLLIYWLVDIRKKSGWFSLIKPAGTETLLCYLVPYYLYAIVVISHWSLPDAVLTGFVGISKSLLFSLLVIVLAGLLTRQFIRLRL
jgi:hypothetical protein